MLTLAQLIARIEKVEKQQRADYESQFPPRIGYVIADDYPDEAALAAAIAAEQRFPGTLRVDLVEFVDVVDGRPAPSQNST